MFYKQAINKREQNVAIIFKVKSDVKVNENHLILQKYWKWGVDFMISCISK